MVADPNTIKALEDLCEKKSAEFFRRLIEQQAPIVGLPREVVISICSSTLLGLWITMLCGSAYLPPEVAERLCTELTGLFDEELSKYKRPDPVTGRIPPRRKKHKTACPKPAAKKSAAATFSPSLDSPLVQAMAEALGINVVNAAGQVVEAFELASWMAEEAQRFSDQAHQACHDRGMADCRAVDGLIANALVSHGTQLESKRLNHNQQQMISFLTKMHQAFKAG